MKETKADRILYQDPSSLQINEDMVISEVGHESDLQGDQVKPFSRPTSGITLERTILPGIETKDSPIKKEKLGAGNELPVKGLSVRASGIGAPAKELSQSRKSRNQSSLNVNTTQITDNANSSRMIGRNGSV